MSTGGTSAGDAAISSALSGGTAGAAPASGLYNAGTNPLSGAAATGSAAAAPGASTTVYGGFGVTGGQDNNVDSAGNQAIQVGTTNISLDPRVNSNDSVPTGGTQTQVQPDVTSDDNVKPGGNPNNTKQVPAVTTVQQAIQQEATWTTTQKEQFVSQAKSAGLITTTSPSAAETAQAYAVVVQEASLQNVTVTSLLAKAASGGWNSVSPTIEPTDAGLSGTGELNNATGPATTNTQTTYVSYMDPATAQGTLADAFQRLLGRNPTTAEYQAFLNSLYGYQNDENTGKFETSEKGTTPASPATDTGTSTDTSTNTVTQRGIGTRGAQFLAGQTAMANPEEGQYQAATTYFNAFIKALSGPAAGLQAAGPTNSAP